MNKSVLIGMSGGVDSSVAAAILKRDGWDVTGAYLRMWDGAGSGAQEDAQNVAESLGIPFRVFDMRDAFSSCVMQPFASEYASGRTPNPCVVCNRRIKFAALLRRADERNIGFIATGHYAHIEQKDGRYLLRRAEAAAKDQTYVLYSLSQEQLSRTLMPLGHYEKEAVRALAQELSLPVADKPDSQDICFIPDGDYISHLETQAGFKPREGNFIDLDGKVIGRHSGVYHFTIGQRKGLGMTFGKPMFVVGIDAQTNTVVLGESGSEFADALLADSLNFLPWQTPPSTIRCKCKTRYRARETDCTVRMNPDGTCRVEFDRPERAVTPGQAIVFYDGPAVLGGGTIVRSVKAETLLQGDQTQ